jgi:hypothetical protein
LSSKKKYPELSTRDSILQLHSKLKAVGLACQLVLDIAELDHVGGVLFGRVHKGMLVEDVDSSDIAQWLLIKKPRVAGLYVPGD